MTKKILLTSVCALLSFGAFAETPADRLANLTEDQKACVETHGCVAPEQPEMTEAQQDYMNCLENAMISCGIAITEPAPEAEPEAVESAPEVVEPAPEIVEAVTEVVEPAPEIAEPAPEVVEPTPEVASEVVEPAPEIAPEVVESAPEIVEPAPEVEPEVVQPAEPSPEEPQE